MLSPTAQLVMHENGHFRLAFGFLAGGSFVATSDARATTVVLEIDKVVALDGNRHIAPHCRAGAQLRCCLKRVTAVAARTLSRYSRRSRGDTAFATGATSLYDVEELDGISFDLAFVDVQLARGTSGLDVCRLIREHWADAYIVFVTANPKKVPDDFCGGHGVIPKPFSRNGLMAAMRYIEEGVCDPPPTSQQPASFTASPAFAASWM